MRAGELPGPRGFRTSAPQSVLKGIAPDALSLRSALHAQKVSDGDWIAHFELGSLCVPSVGDAGQHGQLVGRVRLCGGRQRRFRRRSALVGFMQPLMEQSLVIDDQFLKLCALEREYRRLPLLGKRGHLLYVSRAKIGD